MINYAVICLGRESCMLAMHTASLPCPTARAVATKKLWKSSTSKPKAPLIKRTTFAQAYPPWSMAWPKELTETQNLLSPAKLVEYTGPTALPAHLHKCRLKSGCLKRSGQSFLICLLIRLCNFFPLPRVLSKAAHAGVYSKQCKRAHLCTDHHLLQT